MATTEELMAQYGVAWFGFDEASGNVTDKLGGSYVGTVTGATRVSGWNGEGNAMNFDGNDYITMNNNSFIPTAEKTIRFKIKLNKINTAQVILGNATGYDFKGFRLYIDGSNFLQYYQTHGGSSTSARLATSVKKIDEVDKWYDIMVTRSANNILSFYINDKLDSTHIISKAESTPDSSLLIGMRVTHNDYYLNGQIDDLQIYSKAFIPSDFTQTQNHIAIKTSDNKVITLPNREGRVKEIPTASEVDLINQCYTWREIDNAVDSTGVDLTQTTTEYEVVSKANSTLGNGKVFTIPIDDFKTIKIEDNY